MLVLFPFLAFSFAAYSLVNYIVLHLTNCHLASNLYRVLLLQRWMVRFGLIMEAYLVGLTSDEVSLRVLVVHASSCISFRIPFF